MKYWFVRRRLKQLLQQPRKGSFLPFSAVQSIHILFPYGGYALLAPRVEALRREGKRVTLWAIKTRSKEYDELPDEVRLVEFADFSFWGIPREELIQEMESVSCDLYIDLNSSYTYRGLLLSAYSSAPFRVGIRREGAPIYDLELIVEGAPPIDALLVRVEDALRKIR